MGTSISHDLKRMQESLRDAARVGLHEMTLGVLRAKKHFEKMHVLSRRKDLCAELGRTIYEAHLDGLPEAVNTFFSQTEIGTIIGEIEDLDEELKNS